MSKDEETESVPNKGKSLKKKNSQGGKKKKVLVYTKKKKQTNPESDIIKTLREKYSSVDLESVKTFKDLPLSPKTLKGLKTSGYLKPTEIQLQTLKLALNGEDILGAAQTGSGKTLAFLIPLLELLYCNQWTRYDGTGAVVITPTRELAYQIFEELRKIGEFHEFSAGLIIGGKDLKFERNRMDQCNIVICTPGRLLQHMDENPLFNCDNMKLLVLDEADRILDMGFAETMNAIIANLPLERQTLLFSATQTKSVKDLARLSLKDPRYVAVHDHKEFSTPSELQQSYMFCELHEKVSVLYSFLRNHQKSKIIVFFSSCKQTKYIYEVFCKLRPGISLMALYGSLHQLRRMDIYKSFCNKTHAVLFATDLAARGLDFPQVNWVVQADCPEDAATYIHRVGRTARYHRGGESVLLLLRSEAKMLDDLKAYKIPIEEIKINANKLTNPVRKMEAYLAKDQQLKDTAQRAFKSYIKAVYLMKNKEVFNVDALDMEQFAFSLGLAIAPRIRFLQRIHKSQSKNAKPQETANKITKFESSEDEQSEDQSQTESRVITKSGKKASFLNLDREDEDSDDGMLKIKRANHDIDMPADGLDTLTIMGRQKKGKAVTKAALARKVLNKQIVPNKKIIFDDEGEAVLESTKHKQSELAQTYENEAEEGGGINIETARQILKEEDVFDKQLFKEKVKAKKREAKKKLKERKKRSQRDEEENVDDFGSEESEGEAPDTSWIPDPNKIYGPKSENSDSEDQGNSIDGNNVDQDKDKDEVHVKSEEDQLPEEEEDYYNVKKAKKRKRTEEQSNVKAKKKKNKLKDISSLNVDEAEELALMLLRK